MNIRSREPAGPRPNVQPARRAGRRLGALLAPFLLALVGTSVVAQPAPHGRWVLSGAAENDLVQVLSTSGLACVRCDTPDAAIEAASAGGAVLVLADGYPTNAARLTPGFFASAARKKLRLYVEFAGYLPGVPVGPARPVVWERAVVASDFFGPDLPQRRILSPQNCVFLPVKNAQPHLVLGRVAGYDHADFGLPQLTFPLLFELPPSETNGPILVASTKLSQMVTARFSPVPAWQTVWRRVLGWLAPETQVELRWVPTVRPAWGRDEALSPEAERLALERGARWFVKSRLLLHSSRTNEVARSAGSSGTAPTPGRDAPVGDGSLGILEGYFSRIQPDGSQLQSVSQRGDCHAESAMALAFGGKTLADRDSADMARRILDFWYFTSTARRGERADPKHGAYGLIAWGTGSPAWSVANYGDDNARLLLGTMATAALLEEDRWDEAMLRCLLANLRTTGPLGFRGDRIDIPELTRDGWEHFFRRRITNYAPHYESYLWACYLWAYQKTGYDLFLERARSAIRRTMAAYPDRWRWTNGLQQERARMLLCLAWLTRLEDTPEHRAWLRRMGEDLLALQDASGALRDEIGALGRGQMRPPQSNESYGSGESPLLQKNGDPVCDLLYTCNFALLGLHEAAAATGDPFYAQAEDRLAAFLCRVQVRSERHSELDGGWFRAFDFRLWDYWASNADAGWGAWSIESGWTQGWITSVLALRHLKTSLWELTAGSRIGRHLARLRPEMIPDSALASLSQERVRHAAVGKAVALGGPPSEMYPGDGPASLTDGSLGQMDHVDPAWLGFWEDDLVATIDLGEPKRLTELGACFLQNVRLGIFLPRQVEFLAGDDPTTLKLLQAVAPAADAKDAGPLRETFVATNLSVRARYLRVRAANMKRIPAWHQAAGQKAWLFADEILVNPDDIAGDRRAATIAPPQVSLTLIPPSPVTDQVTVDVRGALRNPEAQSRSFAVAVYLDQETPGTRLHEEQLEVAPGSARGLAFRWPARGKAGRHRVLLVARSGEQTLRAERPLEILPSTIRSTRRLGGAWVDLYHHDEAEGKPFNAELARMTEAQWRELVRAMHAADQDILVITMMFQNFTHRGQHRIEAQGYHGRAYYPSRLFPGRMPIAAPDPLEAILSEADRLGMHVLPGVGMYAFFDYTAGSLRWHRQVADELWERYGHHPSFYGWYVSEEKDGGLGNAEERREIVEFFREFTAHVRRLAPDKPVMLAPNCFHLREAAAAYRELLPHLDIICPFGFHRMPAEDLTGEEAASRMQSWCDQAGCHLWMDLESFVFRHGIELHPRPIAGLVSDFTRLPNFEKTLHYQFPGLMSGPDMSRKPGGEPSVKLYEDYGQFLKGGAEALRVR